MKKKKKENEEIEEEENDDEKENEENKEIEEKMRKMKKMKKTKNEKKIKKKKMKTKSEGNSEKESTRSGLAQRTNTLMAFFSHSFSLSRVCIFSLAPALALDLNKSCPFICFLGTLLKCASCIATGNSLKIPFQCFMEEIVINPPYVVLGWLTIYHTSRDLLASDCPLSFPSLSFYPCFRFANKRTLRGCRLQQTLCRSRDGSRRDEAPAAGG
jgi:hypothetical protein